MKFGLIAMFKNEAMAIREWLEHYKWQGVDRVLLLDNNSTDNWREKVGGLEGFIDVVPVAKNNAQAEHYNTIGMPWLSQNQIDIVGVVDMDEFAYATDGLTLKDHLAKIFQDNSVASVALTMREFGSSGHVKQPASIRKGFTRRMRNDPGRATKCISRVRDLVSLGIHTHEVRGKVMRDPPGLRLNHYMIQSREFFEKVKMTRGDGQHTEANTMRNWNYFAKHDYKDEEDTLLKEQVEALGQKGGRRKQRGGSTPTFHILIPSIGRTSLKGMLDSLKPQLTQGDAVTVVFDGPDAKAKSGLTPNWTAGFAATVSIKVQDPPFRNWGHAIQNEWQTRLEPRTTFIMHGDDDDQYLPGAFDVLRKACTDPETLYIAKMKYRTQPGLVIPRQDNAIVLDDIGTPNGIIPFAKAGEAKWGLYHGGDFTYYNALKDKVATMKFLPDIIYEVLPAPQGRKQPPQAGGRRKTRRKTRRKRRQTRRKAQRGGADLLRQIWCVWVGGTEMSPNRKAGLESIKTVTGIPVVLVTDETLKSHIKPDHPFHPAYEYLSATHKCDYIRTYLMHHYGGGYADIKQQTGSWVPAFDEMERDPSIWASGYPELSPNDMGVTDIPTARAQELRANYAKNIGNGAYIIRPGTPLTTEWITRQAKKLDGYLEALKRHPAKHARDKAEDGSGYPVPWTAILGSIFHDVCLNHIDHVRQSVPAPKFTDYQ